MSDRENLARQWAEEIKSVPHVYHDEKHHAAADHILDTTTPLTMADVEWDYDTHYLAGAIFAGGEEVVMVRPHNDRIVTDKGNLLPEMLTPNGKKYELREIPEPDHPETLVTEEDYQDAPEGTVVQIRGTGAMRVDGGWLCTGGRGLTFSYEMAQLGEGTVLGWGGEA